MVKTRRSMTPKQLIRFLANMSSTPWPHGPSRTMPPTTHRTTPNLVPRDPTPPADSGGGSESPDGANGTDRSDEPHHTDPPPNCTPPAGAVTCAPSHPANHEPSHAPPPRCPRVGCLARSRLARGRRLRSARIRCRRRACRRARSKAPSSGRARSSPAPCATTGSTCRRSTTEDAGLRHGLPGRRRLCVAGRAVHACPSSSTTSSTRRRCR